MKSNLMKKTLGVLALGTLGLMASGAQADWDRGDYGYGHHGHAYPQNPGFNQQINVRQDRQMERIQAGMREGSLTRGEYRELMQEQNEIRAMKHYFRADGMIDAHEYQRLDRVLDIADHNIRTEKHDREARYAYGHESWFN